MHSLLRVQMGLASMKKPVSSAAPIIALGSRRLFSHLQGIQYLIRVQVGGTASFIERPVAAAAIVDARLFKHFL